MSEGSRIEWTDTTWNPVTGCVKVSPGCKHCYAERMAMRLQKMGQERYADGFGVTLHSDLLQKPLHWRKPRKIFVCSMSDLFQTGVNANFIVAVFATMVGAPQHTFQVLTKRPRRAWELAPILPWSENIWLGTSVENADYLPRIEHLRRIPAATRFLSLEPLLGPLPNLPLDGIDWVIAGGESGPGARPVEGDWLRDIRDQCIAAGVPFFFKQWGGKRRTDAGRMLDGRYWDEFPERNGGLKC